MCLYTRWLVLDNKILDNLDMGFVSLCKKIKNHEVIRGVFFGSKLLGSLGTILAAFFNLFVWMNWIPGYEFRRLPKNLVQPQIQLFPTHPIRASPTFVDGSQTNQVSSAKWSLKKDGVGIRWGDSLEPTFNLPPESGIYQLEVSLRLTGENADRNGAINVYVVDVPVQQDTNNKKATISVERLGISNTFLKAAESKGFEVYLGKGGWKEIQDVKIDTKSITIPEHAILPHIDGQVLMRIKGEEKNLFGYSTFPIPAESK